MKVVKTYSVFDPDSHSGWRSMRNNFICQNSTCSFWGAASYDTKGNLLDRNPVDDSRWKYDEYPLLLNPIPCCYDIVVTGIQNYSISESWCQTCNVLNGNYKYVRGYPSTVSDMLWLSMVCDSTNPIHSGYTRIGSWLVVGRDGIEFTNGAFLNDVADDYIYRYDKRDEEGRPTLYVWAITVLFNIWSSSSFDYSIPPGADAYGEIICNNPVYFKTNLGEFKGDYINSGGMISAPSLSLCGTRLNHGDIDMRELSYVVTFGDLWPYAQNPINNYTMGQLDDYISLCDLTGINIGVNGKPPTASMEEHGELKGYRDINTYCSNSYGVPWMAQTPTLINARPEGNSNLETPIGFSEWCGGYNVDANNFYGLIPNYAVVSISGVMAKKSVLESKWDCVDSEDINGDYYVHNESFGPHTVLGCYHTCWYWQWCNDPYWQTYYLLGDRDDVCCQCANIIPSGCVDTITFTLSAIGRERYRSGQEQRASYMSAAIGGATFRLDFENWTDNIYSLPHVPPITIDVVGETFELPLQDEGIYSDTHDFSEAVVSVSFPEIEYHDCLPQPTVCPYWHDNVGPAEIVVNIPNNWIERPDQYVFDNCVWCKDNQDCCKFKYEFRCGYNALEEGTCIWQANGVTECEPNPRTYEDCWGYSPSRTYSVTGLDWCSCCIPHGTYAVSRDAGSDNANYYDSLSSNGCNYTYIGTRGDISLTRDRFRPPELQEMYTVYCYEALSLIIGASVNDDVVDYEGVGVILYVYNTTHSYAVFEGKIPYQPGSVISYFQDEYQENRPMCGKYTSVDQLNGVELSLRGYGGQLNFLYGLPVGWFWYMPYEWGGGNITLGVA